MIKEMETYDSLIEYGKLFKQCRQEVGIRLSIINKSIMLERITPLWYNLSKEYMKGGLSHAR